MSEANGLPIGWALMSITDFCAKRPNAIKRGPFGSTLKKQFFVPTGIKVYEQQHAIQNDCSLGRYYIDETKFEELKAFEVRPGDLIVSCSGTIGKIAVIPEWADIGIINQALLKLTLDRDVVTNAYFKLLFEFFATRIVNDESRGSGMQNLAGVKEIKAIRFPIPPRPEQDRIVGKIEELFSDLEAGVAALRRARGNLKRYRASVLKAAYDPKVEIQKVFNWLEKNAARTSTIWVLTCNESEALEWLGYIQEYAGGEERVIEINLGAPYTVRARFAR